MGGAGFIEHRLGANTAHDAFPNLTYNGWVFALIVTLLGTKSALPALSAVLVSG